MDTDIFLGAIFPNFRTLLYIGYTLFHSYTSVFSYVSYSELL
jgi:hypothetical protein